ncbi:hypothetical protein M0802_009198 [Mischocyttarus mexicanus]|nr:hypothetical protein M0802_009198 [Mischocyttarus mexicanus]
MSYVIEPRIETTATKRLKSTEMKTLRTMTGKTLFDHQCNDDIRKECNIQDSAMGSSKKKRLVRPRCENGEQPITKDSINRNQT